MRLPRMWVVPFKVVLDQTVDATVATTLYMSFVPWAEGVCVRVRVRVRGAWGVGG